MKGQKLIFLVLLSLFILQVIPISMAIAESTESKYKWVFMVYMDADNNLEKAGISDFNEMEMAGSTDDVAIVVMIDRIPGYDSSNGNWTTSRIYLVQHDTDPDTINSLLLVDLGEQNMGDPSTLVYFVKYTVTKFPSENYALVIWDHGNAWRSKSFGLKGVAWDETNGDDYLTEQELVWAFEQITSMGIHLDLIGFDVCLLGMVETVYDFARGGYADVMVASQDYEPLDGWYYTPFLQELIANPDMTPHELGARIVEAFKTFYTIIYPLDYPTLAAIDLQVFYNKVVPNLDLTSLYLLYQVYFSPDLANVIDSIRNEVDKTGEGEFVDVYHFLEKVMTTNDWLPNYDPRPYANRTLNALREAILASWASTSHPKAHGLSIYLPPTVDWYLEERYWYFRQTFFPTETFWGLFLDYYFRTFKPTEEFKIQITTPPTVNVGEKDYALIITTFGNTKVEPDYLSVSMMSTSGELQPLNYTEVDIGTFIAEIPPQNTTTTIFIVADTGYWFIERTTSASTKVTNTTQAIEELADEIKSNTESITDYIDTKSSEIRADILDTRNDLTTMFNNLNGLLEGLRTALQELNYTVTEIRGEVLTIKTSTGEIKANLSDIGAVIAEIKGDMVNIRTILGELNVSLNDILNKIEVVNDNIVKINTSLRTIYGEIVEIDNNVAVIKTDLGTIKIATDNIQGLSEELVSSFDETKSTLLNLNYALLGITTVILI
ncbi:MAG: hypothetical protein J7L82_05335, partial [Staphylothermus sp.]|nr:hypothetical protein [Staphylothermus sp.]